MKSVEEYKAQMMDEELTNVPGLPVEEYWHQQYIRAQRWLDEFMGVAAELQVQNLQLQKDIEVRDQAIHIVIEGLNGVSSSIDAVTYELAALNETSTGEAFIQIQ